MNLENEAFTYILKQYLKGKKDNINFILLSLREFILEKCKINNLSKNEINVLLKFLIHGIDTYSFEKTMTFQDYIDLYIDISLQTYRETQYLEEVEIPNNEFINLFIDNLKQSIEQNKKMDFNLN